MNKKEIYATIREQAQSVLAGESDQLVRLSTIVALLKNEMPHFYWVGFYLWHAEEEVLKVGPYQGTLACLRIAKGRGVCGQVAESRQAMIVPNTHAHPGHIACDAASNSEIVLPVFDTQGDFIGVLDVDSTCFGAFDAEDQEGLEALLATLV